jgi:hypothetical protein
MNYPKLPWAQMGKTIIFDTDDTDNNIVIA